MTSDTLIGVDLGATRVRAARMDDDLNLLAREETLTLAAEGFTPTFERIKGLIRSVWPAEGAPRGIGICIPGPVNPFTGIVELGTNLHGWHHVPLVKLLRDEFGVPVYLGNDANVAALAETARGASQGKRHVVFLTISTGVGGGVIVDGQLLLGKDGYGAECGHIIMVVNGRVSTFEKEAAGPGLARQARERIAAGEASHMREMVNGDIGLISGRIVGEAARTGDPLALDIVRYGGKIVGLGIVSMLHVFNPEIVVLGGGVSTLGDLLFEPMWEAVRQYSIDPAYWRDLAIVPAALGEDVSIVGSGALVVTEGGVQNVSAVARKLSD